MPPKTSTSRLVLGYAHRQKQPFNNFYIASAFTHEPYDSSKTVNVRQIPLADGTMQLPGGTYGNLKINLYGSKTACPISLTGQASIATSQKIIYSIL